MGLVCQWGEHGVSSEIHPARSETICHLISHESNGCALQACCPDVVRSCPELGLWKLKSRLEPAVGPGRMPLEFYRKVALSTKCE